MWHITQELERIKRESTALMRQLEELKASRKARAVLEEQLTLVQLQRSVESLQKTEQALKAHEAAVWQLKKLASPPWPPWPCSL